MYKFSKTLAILLLCIGLPWKGAQADGVEEFLIEICSAYPGFLESTYPDPSPALYNPINVTFTSEDNSSVVNASFSNYQMFDHSKPENWRFANWDIDLSSGTIRVTFEVRKTRFGGKYTAEGIYDGVYVTGKGTWNITTADPSYISYTLHYSGAKITEDEFIDLNAGEVYSLYYYVPMAGIPSVREMDGLVAGGAGPEKLLKDKLFNSLEMETQYMMDHPLPIPLHTYLTVLFTTIPIPETGKIADTIKSNPSNIFKMVTL